MHRRRTRPPVAALLGASLLVFAGFAAAAPADSLANTTALEAQQALKDAWLMGKIETIFALNRQLDPFDIDTQVQNGVVHLAGSVESDIERDLASELARSVEGVADVRNDLKVASATGLSATRRAERDVLAKQRADLRRWIEDASTTAVVKGKLLANQNTKSLDISVKTRNRVVILTGHVGSAEERQLAELLVRNTDSVAEVRNECSVEGARAARRE